MKRWDGLWVPDYESKINSSHRQRDKFLAAVDLVDQDSRHLALDVGAHIGMWTLQMLEVFDRVIAFEPYPDNYACFVRNVSSARASLQRVALGTRAGRVSLAQKSGTSLKTHVSASSEGSIVMKRLDDLEIVGVDFLKIDVEGYDFYVVEGAEETIKRDRPVIIVEQKPEVASTRYKIPDTAAVTLLQSWGYETVTELNGDFIMRSVGG
jgi:FkbM family methyltransferase